MTSDNVLIYGGSRSRRKLGVVDFVAAVAYINYRNANFRGIRKYLKNIVWVDVLNNLECEEMWTVFKCIYDEVINEFVPKQTRRKTKRQPPWWSRKLQKLRKRKEKKRLIWWKRYKISGVHADYVKYKLAMDHARSEVRKATRRHESKIASNIKKDPKMFYRYARSKMDVKEGIGSVKDEDGTNTTDIGKITCILNKYFATVFTEETWVICQSRRKCVTMMKRWTRLTLANQPCTRNYETWTQRKQ